MIIGIPKEIKAQEYRVALTPPLVSKLTKSGHRVLVEKKAGLAVGYNDEAYQNAGASIVKEAKSVWEKADLILKVKEPLPKEYPFLKENLILFTYLHLASVASLEKKLIQKKVAAIGYETVENKFGKLALLKPMSEIAGRLSVEVGCNFLRTDQGRLGLMLKGAGGEEASKVLILGAGNVGLAALEAAMGLGGKVYLYDENQSYLDSVFQKWKHVSYSKFGGSIERLSSLNEVRKIIPQIHLLVGAVLKPGQKAPCLIRKIDIKKMMKNSVIVDVAIDQGGCIEGIEATSHERPTYKRFGVFHYAVPNMPSLVARSATQALSNATFPYIQKLVQNGLKALDEDAGFAKGLQIFKGKRIIF